MHCGRCCKITTHYHSSFLSARGELYYGRGYPQPKHVFTHRLRLTWKLYRNIMYNMHNLFTAYGRQVHTLTLHTYVFKKFCFSVLSDICFPLQRLCVHLISPCVPLLFSLSFFLSLLSTRGWFFLFLFLLKPLWYFLKYVLFCPGVSSGTLAFISLACFFHLLFYALTKMLITKVIILPI